MTESNQLPLAQVDLSSLWQTQLMDCNLHSAYFDIPIKINRCAISDHFNTNSQACWTPSQSFAFVDVLFSSWTDILNSLTFDTGDSSLVYSNVNNAYDLSGFLLEKIVVPAARFTLTLHVTHIVGFETYPDSGPGDFIAVGVFGSDGNAYYVGLGGRQGLDAASFRSCLVSYFPPTGGDDGVGYYAPCPGDDYYIRMVYEPSGIRSLYSTDGSIWYKLDTPIKPDQPDVIPVVPILTPATLGISAINFSNETTSSGWIDYVELEGATSATQY